MRKLSVIRCVYCSKVEDLVTLGECLECEFHVTGEPGYCNYRPEEEEIEEAENA